MGLHLVTTAHESAAPIAAGVYGCVRGGAGVAVAIKGPGVGNLVGGEDATFDGLPNPDGPEPPPLDLHAAVGFLEDLERPVVLVGSAVVQAAASRELIDVAEAAISPAERKNSCDAVRAC